MTPDPLKTCIPISHFLFKIYYLYLPTKIKNKTKIKMLYIYNTPLLRKYKLKKLSEISSNFTKVNK